VYWTKENMRFHVERGGERGEGEERGLTENLERVFAAFARISFSFSVEKALSPLFMGLALIALSIIASEESSPDLILVRDNKFSLSILKKNYRVWYAYYKSHNT